LVNEAKASLTELRASTETLPGAVIIDRGVIDRQGRGPRISNLDPISRVEQFYDFYNPVLNPQTGL
jgi:hypothetical protein